MKTKKIKFEIELTLDEIELICDSLYRTTEQDEARLRGDTLAFDEVKDLKKSVKEGNKIYEALRSLYNYDE